MNASVMPLAPSYPLPLWERGLPSAKREGSRVRGYCRQRRRIRTPSPALASLGYPLPPGEREESRSQTPRDQQLHDLVGAGVDALHAGVAVHARDRVFVHITIAAEQLQTAVDDFVLQVREPVFRHRGGDGIELTAQVPLHAVVVEDAADGRLALALGELELGVLEIDDRLAERLALLDVVDGQPQRALDHADRRGADDQPLLRQVAHQLHEALPFFATEQALGRQLHVLEEQLRGVGPVEAELGEL